MTSRRELNQMMSSLKAEGFEHTCSVLDTDGTGGIFFKNYTTGEEAVIRKNQIVRIPMSENREEEAAL